MADAGVKPGTCVHGVIFEAECWKCVPVENRAAHAGRVAAAYYCVVAAADDLTNAWAARLRRPEDCQETEVNTAERRLASAVKELRKLEGRD